MLKISFSTLLLCAATWPACAQTPAAPATQLAATQTPTWGQEPLQTLSPTRGRICLNGLWKFAPAIRDNESAPKDFGLMPVPGNWATQASGGIYSLPAIAQRGNGANWKGLEGSTTGADWNGLSRAWYERPIDIPASWAGRAITLRFARVSTDANVYVNGQDCGRVAWPGGTIDISRAVTPGQSAILRVLVVASQDQNVEQVFMGTAAGQIETRAASLASKGITNDVFLESAPRGARVASVFVQPSTRQKSLTLDVDLQGVPNAGPVTLTAQCLDEKGEIEKAFPAQIVSAQAGDSTVRISFPWANPRLWDFDRPNLYTLRLSAQGAGISDEFPQSFGFREFWVQGRGFMLNGTPVRLRPCQGQFKEATQIEVMDSMIDGLRGIGFNVQEQPESAGGRGTIDFQDLYLDRADRKGWAMIAGLNGMGNLVDKWTSADGQPTPEQLAWRRAVVVQLKELRNHPAAILWTQTVNRWGGWDDQNPRRVGNGAMLAAMPDSVQKIVPQGIEACNFIRSQDPTRNVSTHQGGQVGDWHTVNNYLDWTPYQEQEEWLSDWAQNGDRPYMPVEFGHLLGCDFKRGRMPGAWGRGQGTTYSEHLTTEYLAMMFGESAYGSEPADAKTIHARLFQGDAKVDNAGRALSANWRRQYYLDRPAYASSDLIEQMMAEHYRRVYRSWRTMGTTGGMLPWEYRDSWQRDFTQTPTAAFVPGQRGVYRPTQQKYLLAYLKPEGAKFTQRTQSLSANDSSTLAWICGAAEPNDVAAFTSKDHSFASGARLQKRVALLNDSRSVAPYSATWTVKLGGKVIASKTQNGTMSIGQTLFLPLEAKLPRVSSKTDGQITLSARIGQTTQSDSFAFRVFAPLAPARQSVVTFDPRGLSSAMLRGLGYKVRAWNGAPTRDLLVIGREAMSSPQPLPGDLGAFVRGGGRVLMLEQTPDWLRSRGFRVGVQVRREAFAIRADHPVLAGLDAGDLRDWAGSGTLVEAKPIVTEKDKSPSGYPVHGWHWGNRGSVSSAPIEKPHFSSWRPILEHDFDLAYSPLLEMESGAGRVVLSELDLEDHAARDAGAARLARNIVEYARAAPLTPKARRVLYLGDEQGAAKLRAMGVQFERASEVGAAPALLICGSGWAETPGARENSAFWNAGGQQLFLSDSAEMKPGLKTIADFSGSIQVPNWSATRGLSASDLRWRAPRAAALFDAAGLAPGADVEAGGLLMRSQRGAGQIVSTQIDPDRFDADNLTYFRLTRWRQSRALSQILANMGATFASDARFFEASNSAPSSVSLSGDWKVQLTAPLPSSAAVPGADDPGLSSVGRAAVAPDFDDATWASVALPAALPALDGQDGEAIARRAVNVPPAWAGHDLKLSLGAVDDLDQTYWNGQEIGHTDASTSNSYQAARLYTVPGALVKAGRNVLAVRVFDRFGGGGLTGPASAMNLTLAAGELAPLYHPDYRTDFILGDDPHRYYRW